jgi:hypothetical protein
MDAQDKLAGGRRYDTEDGVGFALHKDESVDRHLVARECRDTKLVQAPYLTLGRQGVIGSHSMSPVGTTKAWIEGVQCMAAPLVIVKACGTIGCPTNLC